MSSGANTYKKTSVLTASKEKILLMLCEAGLKSCKLAKMALEKEKPDIVEKCKQISKAHDIIMELHNSIDRTQKNELVEQLSNLYGYCIHQLLQANISNDPKHLESVIKVMTTLYEGWVGAIDEIKKSGGKA